MAKRVAREIKYYSPQTDYAALEDELGNAEIITAGESFSTDEKVESSPESETDDLEEYLAWAKETADRAAQSPHSLTKGQRG
jgi:hypothetical protein